MKSIRIDGHQVLDKEDAIRTLITQIGGVKEASANLDALYDVVTAAGPLRVIIDHEDSLTERLGEQWEAILDCLFDSPGEVILWHIS